jgi:uncharacterized SAM-binding protein YcdF (DUF218 family)
MKLWGSVLLAALGLFLAVWAWSVSMRIEQQAVVDEARQADVIIVLGAAEYRGRPSPVLKARLDHALELYRRGYARQIMTTGGAGGDPLYTESEVGRSYLSRHGVPVDSIIVENRGESTAQSTIAAAEIMRRMAMTSCIVVSDGYHIFRAKKMLAARGMTVYGSPRHSLAVGTWEYRWLCLREVAGLALWSAGVRI